MGSSSLLYLVDIDSVKRLQRAEGSLSNDDGDTVNDAWLNKEKKNLILPSDFATV